MDAPGRRPAPHLPFPGTVAPAAAAADVLPRRRLAAVIALLILLAGGMAQEAVAQATEVAALPGARPAGTPRVVPPAAGTAPRPLPPPLRGSLAARQAPAALEAARRFLCPHGGTPVRAARRGGGGGLCRPPAGGAMLAGGGGGEVPGWHLGLAPPSQAQAPCPEGTVAVAPIARNDAQRCLPR